MTKELPLVTRIRGCLNLSGILLILAALQPGNSFCAPAPAPPLQLTGISVAPEASNPNLLGNSSFEETGPDGIPQGWVWDPRNTTATASIDPERAHRGRHSLRLTNATSFGANVYGLLSRTQPVMLQAGKPYTLSAYVQSEAPGSVWMGGGKEWQFRLSVVSTPKDRWRHIRMTFTPGPEDTDFQLHIGTDSPTSGVWIDDIKLEAGSTATPDPPTGGPAALDPAASAENTAAPGDGLWNTAFELLTPQPLKDARLEVTLRDTSGVQPPVNRSQLVATEPGAWKITIQGTAREADIVPRVVSVRLLEGGHEIAHAETSIHFLSPLRAERRLVALRQKLPDLKKLLDRVKASGQDIAYPLVTYTVLQNFVGYADEDLHGTQAARGFRELGELEDMAGRVDAELRRATAGHRLPDVPRWTGTVRPRVSGPSFIAPVTYPARPAPPVDRPVFFIGYGHFNQVKKDVDKFYGYGTNIIQIELGPSAVFPREGVVDEAPVREMRAFLDQAAKAKVAVALLISPHYMPDWMLVKYPELRKKREGFLQYNLYDPVGQAFLKRFLAVLIPPLKDCPALQSICLSNEPINVEEPGPFAAGDWHAWLQKKHGTIETLNNQWGSRYASFDAVPLPDPLIAPTAEVPRPSPIWLEFVRFNQEFFASWHRMLADDIHELAPGLPVHAKAMTWTFLNDQAVRFGVDAQLFGSFSQINGNDSAETYDYGHGDFAQNFVTSEEAYDLQRSVLDAPVFNSENHVIDDRDSRRLPPESLRALLWQDALHGESATTIWVWERTNDPKSDFYGNIMDHPAAVEAVGRVSHDLNRLAREVTAFQRQAPQVILLQSVTSTVWDGPAYSDCLNKLYTALCFTGLPVGFVTERQLAAGKVPLAPVLIIPNVSHLSQAAYAGLSRYHGRLILAGTPGAAMRDEYNRPQPKDLPTLATIPYQYGKTSWQDLLKVIPSALGSLQPLAQVRDGDGKPLWGVEWHCTRAPQGMLISLCNYRHDPVTITLWQSRSDHALSTTAIPISHGTDLFTGLPLRPVGSKAEAEPLRFQLQSLEIKLCRVPVPNTLSGSAKP